MITQTSKKIISKANNSLYLYEVLVRLEMTQRSAKNNITKHDFVYHFCYFCLVLLCFRVRLFIDALWLPAGKELTSWLSFVMSNCEVVTFPLVSWVRCGA